MADTRQEYGSVSRGRAVTTGKETAVVCRFSMPGAASVVALLVQVMGREDATSAAYVGLRRGAAKSNGAAAALVGETTVVHEGADQALSGASFNIFTSGNTVEVRVTGPNPTPMARVIEWEGQISVQSALY